MVALTVGPYRLAVHLGERPYMFDHWVEHAKATDIEGLKDNGDALHLAVGRGSDWYDLVVAFRTSPLDAAGFRPDVLIVPETETLFIGAGEVVKIFDLRTGQVKEQRTSNAGFWDWTRMEDVVICCEELGFAVYGLDGVERWSTFVEPPWEWSIDTNRVRLDVMGSLRYHDLMTGKEIS